MEEKKETRENEKEIIRVVDVPMTEEELQRLKEEEEREVRELDRQFFMALLTGDPHSYLPEFDVRGMVDEDMMRLLKKVGFNVSLPDDDEKEKNP